MTKNFTYTLVLIILLVGCKKNYDEILKSSLEQRNYVPVKVQDIEATTETIPYFAIGRVSSDTETKLSFKTGGYISDLYAREGDYVSRGKLLGSLRTQEIDAQVLKAQRVVDKAGRDLARVTDMYNDSVATFENVQDLETLLEVSEADLQIAVYNQKYSKIVSPVSGRVIRKLAESNELVSPGQPVFVIASSGSRSYIMTVFISDKDIDMIDYGTRAELTFDAFQAETFTAKVIRIAESADPATGTFEIELSIDPGKKRIRNGLIGRVTLYPLLTDRYIKIPMVSISEGEGDKVTVYVPDHTDTIAVQRRIKVARFADDYVWVKRDDMADKRIITVGSAYLKDRQVIRIIK